MNTAALQTLEQNSVEIASCSNGQPHGDLYWFSTRLYKHKSGKWYTRQFGGGAMRVNNDPFWLEGRFDALQWIATEARDPLNDLGYTPEQAEIMVDGGDAGDGQREDEKQPLYCED